MTNTERALRAEWRRIRAKHSEQLAGCSFEINGRFTTRLGVCRIRRATGLPVSVEVARRLTLHPDLRDQAFDTLYHEAAHAMAGMGAGHGPEWKAWCVKLGATPERLARLTRCEQAAIKSVEKPPKWLLTCRRCGRTDTRRRVARSMLQGGAEHTGCGGMFTFKDQQTGRTYSPVKHEHPFGW